MVQLMPLPVNPDWFYLPGFTFLVPPHPGSPGQNPESHKMVVVVVCASLTISIIDCKCYWTRPVAYPMCQSVQKVYRGITADWIRMPFGLVSGVSREICALYGRDDRRRGRAFLGVNLGCRFQNSAKSTQL